MIATEWDGWTDLALSHTVQDVHDHVNLKADQKTKGAEITCTEHEPGRFNGF